MNKLPTWHVCSRLILGMMFHLRVFKLYLLKTFYLLEYISFICVILFQAIDLINILLNVRIERRITAVKSLEDAWFSQVTNFYITRIEILTTHYTVVMNTACHEFF